MTYIGSAKRIVAVILGAIAGLVGGVLVRIVVWSALRFCCFRSHPCTKEHDSPFFMISAGSCRLPIDS